MCRWRGIQSLPDPCRPALPCHIFHPSLRGPFKKTLEGLFVTDVDSIPFAAIPTGANVDDVTRLLPLIDAIPPIRGLSGHLIQRLAWSTPIAVTIPSGIGEPCAIAVSSQ